MTKMIEPVKTAQNGHKSNSLNFEIIERVMISGDLASLDAEQRVQYYNAVCKAVGLNPLTQPFSYINLNGKLCLYANKGCAEQLRSVHDISISVKEAKQIGDVYVVVVDAKTPDGRIDSSTGAVTIKGLGGDALANAFMKCETKAKRRVTLSICSLNMLDETEAETIPNAARAAFPGAKEPAAQERPKQIVEPKPKTNAKPASDRDFMGSAIMKLRKTLDMPMDELTEWAKNLSGKDSLKELSDAQMKQLLTELEAEAAKTQE